MANLVAPAWQTAEHTVAALSPRGSRALALVLVGAMFPRYPIDIDGREGLRAFGVAMTRSPFDPRDSAALLGSITREAHRFLGRMEYEPEPNDGSD